MDNYFSLPHIPEIPTGYAYNMAHVWWICAALILAGIIYLVFACRLAKKTNNWLPVTIWIAGFLFVFPEAVNCLLNCIYWTVSPNEKFTLFTLLGHKMDLHVVVVWWSYVAVVGYTMYKSLLDNASTKKLWIVYGLAVLTDVIAEIVFLGVGGLYVYYGNQPLVVIGGSVNMPLWWMFMNNAGLFLGIAILYRYRDYFNGIRSLWALVILPLVYLGVNAGVAMTTAFAINDANMPWFFTQLMGVITCCLCLLVVQGTMKLVLKR